MTPRATSSRSCAASYIQASMYSICPVERMEGKWARQMRPASSATVARSASVAATRMRRVGPIPGKCTRERSARERGRDSAVDRQRGARGRRLIGSKEDHRAPDVSAGDLGVQQVPLAVELLQLLGSDAARPGAVGTDLPPQA